MNRDIVFINVIKSYPKMIAYVKYDMGNDRRMAKIPILDTNTDLI
jgi:hypothetical protein